MNENVIPLRPREVPRRILANATTAVLNQLPVHIEGNITVNRLLQGLHSVGLTARLDVRANGVVIENKVLSRICPGCSRAHIDGSCEGEQS